MVSITASTLSDLIDDDTLAAVDAEKIIDQSIDLLNLFGEIDSEISNMTGTEGSKTLTVQGYERGAILLVATAVYRSIFISAGGSESSSVGPISYSTSSTSLIQDANVMAMLEKAAAMLAKRLDGLEIEVDVG